MRLSELESWYTPTQAASRLNLTRQYVVRLAEDGRIRGVLVGRAHEKGRPFWALDPGSVEEMIHERGKHNQEQRRGK